MKKLCATCQKEYPEDVESCPADGGKLLVVEGGNDPLIGSTVDGRYVVQSLLGQGGMGAVYKAHQKTMNRAIALKVLKRELSSDPEIVKRFLREVQAVSVLSHPNTITVYDFGQTPDNVLYIAMEYLDGVPLSDHIKATEPMEVDHALDILVQVCGALSEAHEKGIVHRDLKPDNIFMAKLGGEDVVKVLDFGIAKINTGGEQTQLTRSGLVVGTPAYMSPEQAEGRATITPSSDIYSLGCILYECLTGRPPFVADSPVKILMDHCTTEVPTFAVANPAVEVSGLVESAVRTMLIKQPENRPQSAKTVQDHLEGLRRGVDSGNFAGLGAAVGTTAEVSAQAPEPGPGATPAAGVQMHQTDLAGEAVPASTGVVVTRLGRSFPTVAVFVAILVVGIGAGGFFVLKGKGKGKGSGKGSTTTATGVAVPKNAGVGSDKAEEDTPASPEQPRSVWIRSTPANARVLEGGKELGLTPLKIDVDLEKVRRMRLELDGYEAMPVAVDPGMKEGLTVTLVAKAKAVRRPSRRRPSRTRRKPKPKPSAEDVLVDDLK